MIKIILTAAICFGIMMLSVSQILRMAKGQPTIVEYVLGEE